MEVAVVGTGQQVAMRACVTWVASADTIVAMLMLTAPIGTTTQTAVFTSPTAITHAHEIHTSTVVVACSWALRVAAVGTRESVFAETDTPLTHSVGITVLGTRLGATILPSEPRFTHTCEVDASALATALPWALGHLTGVAAETGLAFTLAVLAVTLTVAVTLTPLLFACSAGEAGLAVARAVETVTVVGTVSWTCVQGAIEARPTRVAFACCVSQANPVSIATVGALSERAIFPRESRVAITHTLITEAGV